MSACCDAASERQNKGLGVNPGTGVKPGDHVENNPIHYAASRLGC
jgi:hypothetical protein